MQLVVSLDENGKPITLLEAFESLDITPDTLSIDRLNVSATARTFYRHVTRRKLQSPVQVCHFFHMPIREYVRRRLGLRVTDGAPLSMFGASGYHPCSCFPMRKRSKSHLIQ
jgi:hypothetical protein